ncbi:hypothetical protein D4764_15G0005640 [Takifugu flavidus]|uniref:Uncharacterized protein n=1 Tax=Takifugu flavidus TaxID=433684 RepID=A0A5C6P4M2_9TELE|nr:hypothetical protein D4764_15G0005640 [Takifugu flavidus]
MKSVPLKIQEASAVRLCSVLLCSEAHSDRKQQKRRDDKVFFIFKNDERNQTWSKDEEASKTGEELSTLRSRPKFSSNESRDRVDLQCPLLQFQILCVRLCCEAQSDRKTHNCLQQHSTQLLEAFVTLEGHMTQEEVCSSVSTMLRAEIIQ